MSRFNKFHIVVLILALINFAIGFYDDKYWTVLSIIVLVYCIVVFYFSMNIGKNFFLEATCKMPNENIMLTFDDGPHPIYTPIILDILKEHKVKAMFFVIGKNAKEQPEIIKRIIAEEHNIGGHTQLHSYWFGMMRGKKLDKEIMETQDLLSQYLGEKALWFRPPFGVTNPNIAKSVNKNSLNVIGWNARSFDTVTTDISKLKSRLEKLLQPSSIVLLHDNLVQTSEILSDTIASTKGKGYHFGLLKAGDD